MPKIAALRSPYAKVGRLVYFGRMLDKIRLEAAGALPAAYRENLGDANPGLFDARCCRFLGVNYQFLKEHVHRGQNDEFVLAAAEALGGKRSDEDCIIWNHFMLKRGWRDEGSARLASRIQETPALQDKTIETMFDYIDYDEGRDPVAANSWQLRAPSWVLIMGVAGTGKTTVGQQLAASLGWEFRDADEFHSAQNIAKMSSGQPLDDADRAPWLAAIRAHIMAKITRGESGVVTCSALKETYRQAILAGLNHVLLVHLQGAPELIRQRIAARANHFMKPAMLESQLAALEPPREALTLDIADSAVVLAAQIRSQLSL